MLPVNIAKFLILLNSKNNCERLLSDIFNGSLLHWPKGSRFRLYDRVRLQGPAHRSTFLFLSFLYFWVTTPDLQENIYLDRFFWLWNYIYFFQTIKCCCQVHVQATSLFKIISVGMFQRKAIFCYFLGMLYNLGCLRG